MTTPGFDEREVRYTYWPVNFRNGDLTVISNVPLPLSGVQFSTVMRGVGELKGSLQLADEEVIAANPWEKVIPRKTGIVVVREQYDPVAQEWVESIPWGGIVYAAPRDPHTGRMEITCQSIEGAWARRVVSKGMTWSGADQTTIAADLLDPSKFSAIPLGAAPWPGWITVDPPTNFTGVARDFTIKEGQETNLLEAHQNRSQLASNSYEWTTSIKVLSGSSPIGASSFRVQYLLGYPRLGRQLGDEYPVPRLRYSVDGSGNVSKFTYAYDGHEVANIVWGSGNGYEDAQVRAVAINDEWQYGYLQSEARFSDPDVSQADTLLSYCFRQLYEKLGSEQFLASLQVAGNLPPYFGSYAIGDDLILETNDPTWPPEYRVNGWVDLGARIFGWRVTPPEGEQREIVDLVISAVTR